MVAVAVIGSAVVGAGASIASGNKAANATKAASAANTQLAKDNYAENKATLAPFVSAGAPATSSIQALLGLGGDKAAADKAFEQYRNSTGYDFRLSEGNKGLTAALGKNSMLDSGAAVKSAIKYNQNAGSDEFSRYLGSLQQQQNVGLTAASAQAGVGQNMVNNVTNSNNASAAGQASAALNTGNAISGALQNGVSAYALNQGLKSSYAPTAGTYI